MPRSAERRPVLADRDVGPPTGPAERVRAGGFTLLEIMVALLLVGWISLEFLGIRGWASDEAFKSQKRLTALRHAQDVLAALMLETELYDEAERIVERDPDYHYTLTVEDFDLSTGRPRDEDESTELAGGFTREFVSGFNNDYGGDEDDKLDDPHRVRRVKIVMGYPSLRDEPEQLVIEAFLPRVTEREDGGPAGAGR